MAQRFNFTFIKENAEAGLNKEISGCLKLLSLKNEDSALILPADIPLIRAEDVTSILQFKNACDLAVCPSKDSLGTNALLLRLPPTIQPMFGANSFQEHMKAASSKKLNQDSKN